MNHWVFAVVAYGALQFVGTCLRRFNAIIGTIEGPSGWSPGAALAFNSFGLLTLFSVVGVFIRAGIVMGWGWALLLFVLGLLSSIAIEFAITSVSYRVLKVGLRGLQGFIALSGVVFVPLLFIALWIVLGS